MKAQIQAALVLTGLTLIAVGCGTNEADEPDAGPKKLSKLAKELLVGTWTTKVELDDDKIAEMLKEAWCEGKGHS